MVTNDDMPPWDINQDSKNPIDINMPFVAPKSIFDIEFIPSKQATKIPDKIYNPQQNQSAVNVETKSQPLDNTLNSKPIVQNQALAIKYRPKLFSELIGQESVTKTLCLALDTGRISHAYLFSGLRGSGKTSSARIFARCLQCQVGISSNPCGSCASCVAALNGNSLDIIELDGASNRKIDDIRELIEQTKYKPSIARFKVFIIDEVHMLTREAFNSLLKTLEEPPSYVKFILATTDPLKIPSTILSRTQHFRFKKISNVALKNHLSKILDKEGISYDNASIDIVVRNGHGSVRDTLTLLDQAIIFCEGNLSTDKVANMLGSLDLASFDSLFQALLQKDRLECLRFVDLLDSYDVEMVLDSLSLYIKDKLMQDLIMPVMAMRYANIIADSKALLQIDCDEEFCLLLTVLKMLEAQKIHDIESSIAALESNRAFQQELTSISQLGDAKTQPAHVLEDARNNLQSDSKLNPNALETKSQASSLDNITVMQDELSNTNTLNNQSQEINTNLDINTLNEQEPSLEQKQKYSQMLQAISQRDFDTGEIFENHITFDKVDSSFIYLSAYTNEEQNLILRQSYKGILDIARQVFGLHISIKVDKKPPSSYQVPLKTQVITKVDNSTNASIESIHNQTPKQALNLKQNTIRLGEETIKDFVKDNQKILDTIKSELGINNVKLVDYK
ncbi:DNA polymerase III subunit gamma/tau [Helicobacter muridarum]|uniref:DNA polymerase III subunit gamma/tau n=3 Tax=Helicobacter muridarum TaxID=216 RepID=A0A377PX64_9HELI|nr:DNA polymerase III subunit gamma/tau [Helicobacter muridarum]TLE01583.1 DNA polymerase III subunit gamma/tau [Helicobacter muridarum]STQ86193.1 DNA polymerase III subunits gamma and tau [Helicobacter muridarum]